MVAIFGLLVLASAILQVYSLDSELQRQSVLYGISALAENDTECSRQLLDLVEAADLKLVWALKGNSKTF